MLFKIYGNTDVNLGYTMVGKSCLPDFLLFHVFVSILRGLFPVDISVFDFFPFAAPQNIHISDILYIYIFW